MTQGALLAYITDAVGRARTVGGGLAALAVILLSVSTASAERTCDTRKITTKTRAVSATTTSGAFETVPGIKVRFAQGGREPGCVVVQVTGVAETSHTMVLRARIGSELAQPELVLFTRDDAGTGAHAFNFVLRRVPPGKYRVVIEWHAFYGIPASMHQRTVLVQHR